MGRPCHGRLLGPGLAWIVVYYLAPDLKYFRELGNWNLAVGMVFIAIGFIFSTMWE